MLQLLFRPAQSFGTDLLIKAYVKVSAEICDHAHFGATSMWQIVILMSHVMKVLYSMQHYKGNAKIESNP